MLKVVPLISTRLVWVALALGAAFSAAGAFVPTPWNLVLAALGSVGLYLGGLGWRAPAWAAGKPLLPLALVPVALGGVALLERFLPLLPESWQGWGALAVGVLSLLAGKVTPEPLTLHSFPSTTTSGFTERVGPSHVQLTAECSLEDAARGLCK